MIHFQYHHLRKVIFSVKVKCIVHVGVSEKLGRGQQLLNLVIGGNFLKTAYVGQETSGYEGSPRLSQQGDNI